MYVEKNVKLPIFGRIYIMEVCLQHVMRYLLKTDWRDMSRFKTTKELPISERPYEKCEQYGAKYLSDAELLSVIIRTGTKSKSSIDLAKDLLEIKDNCPGLKGLSNVSLNELIKIKGIGKVKAIQILCVVELTKRMSKVTNKKGICFNSPKSIASYFMQDMRNLDIEQIRLVLLNSKNKMIKEMELSRGTVNSSLVSPREVLITALRYEAVNVVLLHNHPSGDPTPSKEDIKMTYRMKESAKLIGINLVDHIVIGDNIYTSLGELGYI